MNRQEAPGPSGIGIALIFGIFYALFYLARAALRSDLFKG